jgi:hypothetical protein
MKPRRGASAERIAADNKGRAEIRTKVAAALSQDAIVTTDVLACDSEAAEPLGTERIRRTLDVINFFARLVTDRPEPDYRAHLRGDGESAGTIGVIAAPPDEAHVVERPPRLSIRVFAKDQLKAQKVGIAQAHALLSLADPTDLQLRILNALSWAGRANVVHREEAFLFLAIALEALLSKPDRRAGVTETLRLRSAYLISDGTPEMRRGVYERVGELYRVRSGMFTLAIRTPSPSATSTTCAMSLMHTSASR